MQSADTLPPGKTSGYLALASQAVTSTNGQAAETSDKAGNGTNGLTFWEVGTRVGLAHGVDLGIKSNFQFGSFFSDIKFRLLRFKALTIASGVGLGYLSLDASTNGGDTALKIYEFHFPVYSTFSLHKYVDLTITPRYIQRSIAGQGESSAFSGSTGLFVGSGTRGVVEYTVVNNLATDELIHQVTVGVILGYDKDRRVSRKGASL